MALIIALILILIIGTITINDKAKSAYHDEMMSEKRSAYKYWEALHCDPDLELRLRNFIASPQNYEVVSNEVKNALKEMGHWSRDYSLVLSEGHLICRKGTQKDKQHRLSFDRGVALNIMLANRGKVSRSAARYGYESYLNNDSLKFRQYEYVEWITNTLRNKGVHITPLHMRPRSSLNRYVWENSPAALSEVGATYTEFNRSLLDDVSFV